MSALRVLHVIPGVAPRYGGPSQAVLGMVRALRGAGVEAEIATTDADGRRDRLAVEVGRRQEYGGCPCWFFRRNWGEGLKYSRGLSSWLEAHVGDYALVHIHAVFSHSCVKAGRVSLREQVPYVVRPLGTLDPWSLRQRAWRKRLFWWLGARGLLEHAAAVHYTSRAERLASESSLGLARGVVIPIGVEVLPPSTPCEDPPYVLVLGRLHRKKRIEQALEAFDLLHRAGRLGRWELWIAGSGEPEYEAELRCKAARLGPRARFLGWVEGAEKSRVLAGASLLVLPSRQENFGIAVAEGMAAGVPVLISPEVDLSGEVARRGAGWVVPAESGALAGALVEALTHPGERRTRGAAGRALAQELYEWRGVAEQLRCLYLRLLSADKDEGSRRDLDPGGARLSV